MTEWKGQITINRNIERVWEFLDGSEKNLKILDPKIQFHRPIEEITGKVGSRYHQGYKEGNRVMEYEVVVNDYKDTPEHKEMEIGFVLAKMFDITARHSLKKMGKEETLISYRTTNNPLKITAKLIMLLTGRGGNKLIEQHLQHLKDVIENDRF